MLLSNFRHFTLKLTVAYRWRRSHVTNHYPLVNHHPKRRQWYLCLDTREHASLRDWLHLNHEKDDEETSCIQWWEMRLTSSAPRMPTRSSSVQAPPSEPTAWGPLGPTLNETHLGFHSGCFRGLFEDLAIRAKGLQVWSSLVRDDMMEIRCNYAFQIRYKEKQQPDNCYLRMIDN